MQIFIQIIFIILLMWSSAQAQSEKQIQKADSLFESGNYTTALSIYENSYKTTKKTSLHILMKMAFIQEGLGNYSQTLYYLSLYQLRHPNSATLLHMKSIAEQYKLLGYEYADVELLRDFYYRYFAYFISFLLIVNGLWLSYLFYRTWRGKKIHTRYKFIFMGGLLILLFFILAFEEKPQAIIIKDETYLMDSPSAGAYLIEKVQKGHKIKVLEKQDIWFKISWGNRTAFVRESQLILL